MKILIIIGFVILLLLSGCISRFDEACKQAGATEAIDSGSKYCRLGFSQQKVKCDDGQIIDVDQRKICERNDEWGNCDYYKGKWYYTPNNFTTC